MSPRDTWQRHDGPATKRLLKHLILNAGKYALAWPAQNEKICDVLRKWKDAWARDMREADRNEETPTDGGDAWWAQNMVNAETEITRALGPPLLQEKARAV